MDRSLDPVAYKWTGSATAFGSLHQPQSPYRNGSKVNQVLSRSAFLSMHGQLVAPQLDQDLWFTKSQLLDPALVPVLRRSAPVKSTQPKHTCYYSPFS